MTERELLDAWARARLHIVISQIAPTFLLIVTVWLVAMGLGDADLLVRWATIGILLASGILGALAQYGAATEAIAVSRDVAALETTSQTSSEIAKFAPWLNVVRFLTPAIFVGIFALLVAALV